MADAVKEGGRSVGDGGGGRGTDGAEGGKEDDKSIE